MVKDAIKVLMMEDDPGDIKLTRESFKQSKLFVYLSTVSDGKEGMEYLRKQGKYADAETPDLILLDLNMPRMDGRQALHEIKNDKNLKLIPVVILTTSQQEEDIARSYTEGANCYVSKPLDFHQFEKVVAQIADFWFSVVKLPHMKGET